MESAVIILESRQLSDHFYLGRGLSIDRGRFSFTFNCRPKKGQTAIVDPATFSVIRGHFTQAKSIKASSFNHPNLSEHETLIRFDLLSRNYNNLCRAVDFADFLLNLTNENHEIPTLFGGVISAVEHFSQGDSELAWRCVCLCQFLQDYGGLPEIAAMNSGQQKLFRHILSIKGSEKLPPLKKSGWLKMEQWLFQILDRLNIIHPGIARHFSFFKEN